MTPKTPPNPKPDKSRLLIGGMLALVLLGGIASFMASDGKPKKVTPRKNEFVTITLPPPPPPPPPPKVEPPKQEEPPKEDEIVEEEPVDLTPPDEPVEAPPSEDLGTNITGGNGPDMGLSAGGGNGRAGGRKGGLGGTNVYARYSLTAKATIESALRNDPVTRKAILNGLVLEFWPDSGGTITRARIIGSSAGSEMDQAVKRVLVGLRTPPARTAAEMPPSVKIRINARKSS
jgi:periplasmic protein TonB